MAESSCVPLASRPSKQSWRAARPVILNRRFYHGYLARVLRREPQNRVVADRIVSALSHRNFCLPSFSISHSAPIATAEFSPDGERIVTASKDKTARLWDSRTGQALQSPFSHDREVFSARFSSDGQKIVTASRDGTARVWEARPANRLPLRQGTASIGSGFSPCVGPKSYHGSCQASSGRVVKGWSQSTGEVAPEAGLAPLTL